MLNSTKTVVLYVIVIDQFPSKSEHILSNCFLQEKNMNQNNNLYSFWMVVCFFTVKMFWSLISNISWFWHLFESWRYCFLFDIETDRWFKWYIIYSADQIWNLW